MEVNISGKILLGTLVSASLLTLAPVGIQAARIDETEPNETKATADELQVGDTYFGEIGSYDKYRRDGHVDTDYIKVKLQKNKSYI